MGKAPAFQFYPGDWRRDTQVQMASMETRGVWFEMLCCMWDAPERGKLSGAPELLCRLLGCEMDVFMRSVKEIEILKIGDVTNGHNDVTIINRRMSREQNIRDGARLRKQKERDKPTSHTPVTPPSSSSSSSSSSKEIKDRYMEGVLLTKKEYQKLLTKLGQEKLDRGIEILNNYIMSKGKKYKSHYHTFGTWVIDRIEQDFNKKTVETENGRNYNDMQGEKCKCGEPAVFDGMCHACNKSTPMTEEFKQAIGKIKDMP